MVLSSALLRNRALAYFKGKFSGLSHYWRAYGGIKAIVGSPYFHVSIIITILMPKIWLINKEGDAPWVEFAKSIVPSMAAFSLGAMAIIFTVSSGEFFDIIRKKRSGDSYYVKLMASFVHFIVLQIMTIFGAMATWTYSYNAISGVFFAVFCYSLLSGIAAAGMLMGLAYVRGEKG